MEVGRGCRMELVSARLIKRMPGLGLAASPKGVGKAREFAKRRGHCRPVALSDSDGFMTLLAGAAAFEACLEDKGAKVPAVVVRTEGGADDLMFALQSAELDCPPCAVAVSSAIVQLIDLHGAARKHIAESLGKTPSWVCRMESLSRRLNASVRKMVAAGQLPARSAQEIARLPGEVQTQFAVSAANDLLGKESIAYLVSRYLSEDAGPEERARIVGAPRLALPDMPRRRRVAAGRAADGASLARAIARLFDGAARLSSLLVGVDSGEAAASAADAMALADSLAALAMLLKAVFDPGKGSGGGRAR
ncbi:MAG: hypothetical protein FWH01_16340 [Oscillospiraceae bacterium]|nr:hypothetical protein [Oscillospiraceae bacterium]